MDARLSHCQTPSRTRREALPALVLLVLAASVATISPPPAHAQGADSLQLSWTAPGDDGNVGTATRYEMRMSPSPISEANWSSAACQRWSKALTK